MVIQRCIECGVRFWVLSDLACVGCGLFFFRSTAAGGNRQDSFHMFYCGMERAIAEGIVSVM
jgi:hypothetical protein